MSPRFEFLTRAPDSTNIAANWSSFSTRNTDSVLMDKGQFSHDWMSFRRPVMTQVSRSVRPLCVFLLLATACAKEEPVQFETASTETARVMFYAPNFVDKDPRVRVRTTRGSRDEYVTWWSGGASAAFWYGSAFPGKYWRRLVENQPEKMLRNWKEMKTASLELKEGGTVSSPLGGIIYWRFHHEERRNCFTINHFWGPAAGDQGGYRDWINGYFCKPEGVILSDEDIDEMLSRLDVRTGDENPAGTRRD